MISRRNKHCRACATSIRTRALVEGASQLNSRDDLYVIEGMETITRYAYGFRNSENSQQRVQMLYAQLVFLGSGSPPFLAYSLRFFGVPSHPELEPFD